MQNPRNIRIEDYDYNLPTDRIAEFPEKERDQSKLLIFREGQIDHGQFRDLANFLSPQDTLVFNNARVINARLQFRKPSGGLIEIFVLEPYKSTPEIALKDQKKTVWKCFVGGAKKWKEGEIHAVNSLAGVQDLSAKMISRDPYFLIEFSWHPSDKTWGEVMEIAGKIPLPPYINREVQSSDEENYQTVYAKNPGSVAAPTAGLHFSEELLSNISKKGIQSEEVTLHVGAGTFKPVSAVTLRDHDMHEELISVELSSLKGLLSSNNIVAVGTTAMRSLESLYWLATKLDSGAELGTGGVGQWDGFELEARLSKSEALAVLIQRAESKHLSKIELSTSLLIAPSYHIHMVDALITNFHMPKSTLLVLVAAAIGDVWTEIYDEALRKNYRFLSYGDGSFLRFGAK